MIAADGIPGPRIFTTGPHIDGENPAYPADSVVARDAEEARRHAELSVAARRVRAEDLFPASVRQREGRDRRVRGPPHSVHRAPGAARRARADCRRTPRHRARDVVRHQPASPPWRRKRIDKRSSRTTTRGATDGIVCLRGADLDGPEAQALYAVLRERKPFLDADARRLRTARRRRLRRRAARRTAPDLERRCSFPVSRR